MTQPLEVRVNMLSRQDFYKSIQPKDIRSVACPKNNGVATYYTHKGRVFAFVCPKLPSDVVIAGVPRDYCTRCEAGLSGRTLNNFLNQKSEIA